MKTDGQDPAHLSYFYKGEFKMEYDVKDYTRWIIEWIQGWFNVNGKGCNAIVGISGGKDSTIVAKLCCEALGEDRVSGVLIPMDMEPDPIAYRVIQYLGIHYTTIIIGQAYKSIIDQIYSFGDRVYIHKDLVTRQINEEPSAATKINLPARLRMAVLYAHAQSNNGRVANTCNFSEDYVGYSTRYGDSVGDFSPISNFTVTEVKEIGRYLGIPNEFIDRPPEDGLCGKTDEDNLGFTYDMLDKYITEGILPPPEIKEKIDRLHKQNLFKLKLMESCPNPFVKRAALDELKEESPVDRV